MRLLVRLVDRISPQMFVCILFFLATFLLTYGFGQIASVWFELFSGEEVINFW
jgi:hypothetical protein